MVVIQYNIYNYHNFEVCLNNAGDIKRKVDLHCLLIFTAQSVASFSETSI